MKKYFPFVFILLLGACLPLPPQGNGNGSPTGLVKTFKAQDTVYEKSVKTVLLYPARDAESDQRFFNPPVIPLSSINSLVLEYDILGEEMPECRAKIVHCTYDWKPSNINTIEYLNAFNDILVRFRQMSFNTRVPYAHYRLEVPPVKISGNYVLKIFRNSDESDLLLTRRFIVYQNRVAIDAEVNPSAQPDQRKRNHQIDFDINYKNYPINNPRDQIKVTIRQNDRWDKAIYNLKPLFIREFQKKLEYRHFNLENNFKAGNEFRRFELNSIRFLGFNVANIQLTDTLVYANLYPETSNGRKAYVQRPDLNGAYVIRHYESGKGELEADYISFRFHLKAPPEDAPVYVMGSYNDWKYGLDNQMQYDNKQGLYYRDLLLKQGRYNYVFGIWSDSLNRIDYKYFEENHQQTENNYDIIVYDRPIGSRFDLVIGYRRFNSTELR